MRDQANADLVRRYFTLSEQVIINQRSTTTAPATLQSATEFDVYLKYCTFNLSACGMREFDTAEEDFRPVAELNILVLENILTDDEANDVNVGAYVDGQTVLTSLAQVKEKVACNFDDDKDKD